MKKLWLILALCAPCLGQAWSGVLAPARAIDWSNVGITGGLPDASWTQCGSTVTAGTSAATVQTQINGCSAQTYILLGAGTFNWSTGVSLKNQVVLRGSGANSTFIVFSGHTNCNGLYAQFVLCGDNNNPGPGGATNYATWTAGFSQGATSITLSNSLHIVAGSTQIVLDQQDNNPDNGQIFNCIVTPCATTLGGNSGSARTDQTCSSSVSPNVGYCSQQQEVLVTACSPSCNNAGSTVVTISPGLYMPNWASAQSTGAWWATTTAYRMGVEDLSADLTSNGGGASTVVLMNCYECWVSGIRSIDAARNHVWLYGASKSIVQHNYFYQSTTHNSQSYSIELFAGSSDNLLLNNICQQVTDSCPNNNGGGAGNVAAYNFSIDDIFLSNGWFQQSDYDHAAGLDFWLREGNAGLAMNSDSVHGTHNFTTIFRNRYPGWAAAGCGSAGTSPVCSSNTSAFILHAASRYFNLVGNVGGQASYHTNYLAGPTAGNQNVSVFYIGAQQGGQGGTFCANPTCSSTSSSVGDPLTLTSAMLWGNWDNATNATRFCTANATPIAACTGDERAGSFGDTTGSTSIYAGLSSPSTTLPNSFFLTASTAASCGTGLSWWKNPTTGTCPPFPAIGPDVTSGNMGLCSGGTYDKSYAVSSGQCTGGSLTTAFGGHANANPAMACYLNVMGGPPDGTGSVLTFNRTSCYASDPVNSNAAPFCLACSNLYSKAVLP